MLGILLHAHTCDCWLEVTWASSQDSLPLLRSEQGIPQRGRDGSCSSSYYNRILEVTNQSFCQSPLGTHISPGTIREGFYKEARILCTILEMGHWRLRAPFVIVSPECWAQNKCSVDVTETKNDGLLISGASLSPSTKPRSQAQKYLMLLPIRKVLSSMLTMQSVLVLPLVEAMTFKWRAVDLCSTGLLSQGQGHGVGEMYEASLSLTWV